MRSTGRGSRSGAARGVPVAVEYRSSGDHSKHFAAGGAERRRPHGALGRCVRVRREGTGTLGARCPPAGTEAPLRSGKRRGRPGHPHRRGPAALPRVRLPDRGRENRREDRGAQLRPRGRGHHVVVGHLRAGGGGGVEGRRAALRRPRVRRRGPGHRPTAPAARGRGHDLRQGPAAAHDVEHRRGAVVAHLGDGRGPADRGVRPEARARSASPHRAYQQLPAGEYGMRWLPNYVCSDEPLPEWWEHDLTPDLYPERPPCGPTSTLSRSATHSASPPCSSNRPSISRRW